MSKSQYTYRIIHLFTIFKIKNMKIYRLLLAIIAFHAFLTLTAQDVIYKVDGTEIKAKVVEITLDAVKYRNFDQPAGPVRNIFLTDVFMIIYEDGSKEVFKKNSDQPDGKDDLTKPPAEQPVVPPDRKKHESPVDFTVGIKGGVYFPVGDVIHDVYGVAFRAEADLDIWSQKGWGGGMGVGFSKKEGDPHTFGSVENAWSRLTLIPLHISGGYRLDNGRKAMPYFMSGFVATPFWEYLEGDYECHQSNQVEHTSFRFLEWAFGFNVLAGIQWRPVYIEAIFSYENYQENNVGGLVVAAGVKF